MRPFFSIIIPTFNSGNRITKTIKSIERQTFCSYEIIIVDGKSEDESIGLIKNYEKFLSNIKVISECDAGIYDGMNKGIRNANGKYTIFLGAGDYLIEKNILNVLYTKLNSEKTDILYGYVIGIKGGEKKKFVRHINFWYTIRFQGVCHQAIVARRELFTEKMYDIRYRICADQDWLLYMYKAGKNIAYIDCAISGWILDGVSNSDRGFKLGVHEKFRIQKQYYPLRYVVHRFLWLTKQILRKVEICNK